MRTAPRLLVSDIEGTLTDRTGRRSSEELLHKLKSLEENGVPLVLCSGRDVAYQRALKERWGLDPDGPLVAENGASVFFEGREYITYHPDGFQRDILIAFLKERGVEELGELDPAKSHAITVYPKGFMEGLDYSPDDIKRIYVFLVKHLKGSHYRVLHTSASGEVLPRGVDKGTGLDRLLKLARLDPAGALFLGDGQNDLSAARMILKGRGRVAVPADAFPALRRIATYVSEKPYFHGAEDILDHFFPDRPAGRRGSR